VNIHFHLEESFKSAGDAIVNEDHGEETLPELDIGEATTALV